MTWLLEFRRVLLRSQAEDGIRDAMVTGVQTCALPIDRKSTRLNSSHLGISYAVFCLEIRRVLFRSDRKSTRLNSSHHGISYAVFCLYFRHVLSFFFFKGTGPPRILLFSPTGVFRF